MRKFITGNGTFYYPEERISLVDTEEIKIIVENPVGYVVGDLVRMFYYFMTGNSKIEVGVNTFEMFSPLVNSGGIKRAIFYLPLAAEFASNGISFNPIDYLVYYVIKPKGSTDFSHETNVLISYYSFINLTNSDPNTRSSPIPVFFFSERGAGLFENKILNRQNRLAVTNFSSVAIRQYKFNPHNMGIGGRNLLKGGFTNGHWGQSYIGSNTIGNHGRTVEVIELITGQEYYFSMREGVYVRSNGLFITFRNIDNTYNSVIIRNVANFKFIAPAPLCTVSFDATYYTNFNGGKDFANNLPKLEKGNKATAWTPAPEDYEITEVVSGTDLAMGLAKFNSSYAFKLLDDSEWVTKKLVCPENYIQLFWGEPRSATRFSFWFKIKEIEKSSEAWGEVEHYRELRAGTDVKERRKDVTKYRFPKTKLKLTSGVFRKDIIDRLKGIVHSPAIYKYNPYTKLNEGRGVVAQVTELRNDDGMPTEQGGTGHFKLDYGDKFSNTIEELVNSPEYVFDLEFSFRGTLTSVHFLQNRDDLSNSVLISNSITETSFTKKTFNSSIVIDRTRNVKPLLRFRPLQSNPTEIKDIYIKGSLGGVEDVEVEIATMNIIPHQDGESEMELTVISDDFRKPDYLYF